MVDNTLTGNCEECPACALRRENLDLSRLDRGTVECNRCGGTGLLPLSTEAIIAQECQRAAVEYWPAFEARCAAHNKKTRRKAGSNRKSKAAGA